MSRKPEPRQGHVDVRPQLRVSKGGVHVDVSARTSLDQCRYASMITDTHDLAGVNVAAIRKDDDRVEQRLAFCF